ncbi:MAG: hypothetical protein PHQ23_08725 [Candidatus Wallbacteria bacterium]|nr:hypothetical protein [Candidatus Wallbacteria bacterium]
MKYHYLFLLLLLTGCGKSPMQRDPSIYSEKIFQAERSALCVSRLENIKLPFKSGEVDPHPFFVSQSTVFFYSRQFNHIKSCNLESSIVRTFTDPDMTIQNFTAGEDTILFNDSAKGKIVSLDFDMTRVRNFLGQIHEDKLHNGHRLIVCGSTIFQYNFDHPLITQFSAAGKITLTIEMPTYNLAGIEALENGNILLFYPEKIVLFSPKGEMLNNLEVSFQNYLVYPVGDIFLQSGDAILQYNNKLKLVRRYLVRNRKIDRFRRAKTQALYYSAQNEIFHLLSDGRIEKVPIECASSLKDFIPTYDQHFLVHDSDGFYLFNNFGQRIKKYELLFHYFDFYFFRDSAMQYYMADAATQMLAVADEATDNIVQNILYNLNAFSRDSNIVFDASGSLYFVNRVQGNIEKITAKYTNQQFPVPGTTRQLPFSVFDQLLFGPDESVYLFRQESQTVLKYSKNGDQIYRLGNLGKTDNSISPLFRRACTISVDSLSHLYVLDVSDTSLFIFNHSGDFIKKIMLATILNDPLYALTDRYNIMWLQSGGSLLAFDTAAGTFLKPMFPKDAFPCLSFTITPDRKLYLLTESDGYLVLRKGEIQDPVSAALDAYRSHRFKEAGEMFAECRTLFPGDPYLAFYAANCYVQLDLRSEALKILEHREAFDTADNELDQCWSELQEILEDSR